MKKPSSILITGASSGLGRALALVYASKGVQLLLTGRNPERLAEVANACRKQGAEVIYAVLDVANTERMNTWLVDAYKKKPIELAIANAGISAGTGGGKDMFDGETAGQSRRIFEINLVGVLNTVHPLLPLMQERKSGQLALISSLAGFRGVPGAPSYSASKAAVKSYGEALRGVMKPHGVGVTVVCPGYIKTPMTEVNKFFMPQLMPAEKAALYIKEKLEKNPPLIAFPAPFSWGVRAISALPCRLTDPLFARLPKKPAAED